MTRQTENPDNTCGNCGKALFGRIDKRFCNDNCRNSYNRNKALLEQKKAHDNLPEIFRIIKRNYEILQRYELDKMPIGRIILMDKNDLIEAGFNFRFCTSIYYKTGSIPWKFCFELGWQEFDDGVELIYWRDQAEIEAPSLPSRYDL